MSFSVGACHAKCVSEQDLNNAYSITSSADPLGIKIKKAHAYFA
jgi:hypothetical protein